MASQIQLTRSGTPGAQPTATEMELGELALNYADGKLYFKNDTNNIELLNSMSNMSGQKIIVNEIDNHIGLNTTSPNFLLDLGGAVSHTDNTFRINQTTGGTAIRIGSDGVADGEDITLLRVDNLDGETNSAAEGFAIKYLGTNSNNELGIFTDNGSSELQALTILQNGNVGIGVATPGSELDVAGTINVTDSTNFITFNDGSENMGFILNNAGKLAINAGGTTDVLQLQTNGGTRVHIDNAGKVGIGTTSPTALLHVKGTDGSGTIKAHIQNGAGGQAGLDIQNSEGHFRIITDGGAFRIYDQGDAADRMAISTSGDVGIGTTTPSAKLDVVGNITATGTATAATPTADTHLTTKAYVDNTYQPGEIVQQFYHRVDDVLVYGIDGTTGKIDANTYQTSGQTNFRIIDLQGLNFISGSGGTGRSLYAINMEAFEISITPKYSNSLIVVEYNICGETGNHNTGTWMGEVNSSGAAQVITRSGYEGYNPKAPVGYNNSYFSNFYQSNDSNTLLNHMITYIDKPNTTSQKTYVPIYHSIHGDLSNREFHLNRTTTLSTAYNHEYGVSNMSIKEIRQ